MNSTVAAWILTGASIAFGQVDTAFEAYCAQMAAAEKSLRLDEARELRTWLDATDPSLRGWEWNYLAAVADTARRRVPLDGTPIRIEMAPAGDSVAVVVDSSVRVLSWPGLDESMVLSGHTNSVYRADFSADGTRLATVARDRTSRVWDRATGAEIARITLPDEAFAAVAFAPDGRSVATCAWERVENEVHGVVWIWDAQTGEVMHRERVGVKPLSAIEFLPDGSGLVVGSWDGVVHVLDESGAETQRLVLPDEGIYNAVNDLAVSPDGRMVAVGSKDRTARVFSMDDGALRATLRGHSGFIEGVRFSPDGTRLVTASADATAAVWDTDEWRRLGVLRGPTETVRGAVWSADGAELIACALDDRLWVWSSGVDDAAATTIETGARGIYSAAMSPDGTRVAVACFDGGLRVYDAMDGSLIREWIAHPDSTCHAASYSAAGDRLVTASWDRTARVWDPRDGGPVAVLETGAGVYSAAISPDGLTVVTAGAELMIWDVETAARRFTASIDGAAPRRAEFSADGAMIASGWTDGRARVHDARTGALIASMGTGLAAVESAAFDASGERVAAGDAAGTVAVYPVRGGDAEWSIDTGGRAINHVAWEGSRIGAASDRLWIIDSDRGGIVLGLRPHADSVWHLSWRGGRLATCTIPGTVRILGK